LSRAFYSWKRAHVGLEPVLDYERYLFAHPKGHTGSFPHPDGFVVTRVLGLKDRGDADVVDGDAVVALTADSVPLLQRGTLGDAYGQITLEGRTIAPSFHALAETLGVSRDGS